MPPTQIRFEVLGACPHDCPDSCSLITTVDQGRAVQVRGNPEHRHTAGVLCAKVARYPERTHHPERLLYPLRRIGPKGSGQFERVSWDQALSDIATRLQEIAARDPQAILPYSYAGTMGLVQGESMDRRFFHRLGASRLDRTICASAGAAALDAGRIDPARLAAVDGTVAPIIRIAVHREGEARAQGFSAAPETHLALQVQAVWREQRHHHPLECRYGDQQQHLEHHKSRPWYRGPQRDP